MRIARSIATSQCYAAAIAGSFIQARAEIVREFKGGYVCRSIAAERLRAIGCFEAEINIELKR